MRTSTRGRTDEGAALIDAIVAVAVLLVAVVVILTSFSQAARGSVSLVERVEEGIEEENEKIRMLPGARTGRNNLR